MTGNPAADDAAMLGDVFSSNRDRGGTDAPPEAPAQQQEQPQQNAAPASSESPDPNANRHVPLSELLGEREKRKSEAKLREEAETRAKFYSEQLEQLRRQPQQPAHRPQPPPDPFTDPEGALNHAMRNAQDAFENRLLDMSEANTREAHGDQLVNEAFQAAVNAGLIQQGAFMRHGNPWGAMVKWYSHQKAISDIGDPKTYAERIRAEERQRVLGELQSGQLRPSGQPANTPRFPGTLADATSAGGGNGAALTDEAIMAGQFSSSRRRR